MFYEHDKDGIIDGKFRMRPTLKDYAIYITYEEAEKMLKELPIKLAEYKSKTQEHRRRNVLKELIAARELVKQLEEDYHANELRAH